MFTGRRTFPGAANPSGLCQCGCGATTPISAQNKPTRGYYAGEHVRFIKGHQKRMYKGAASASWHGGRVVTPSGYVYLYRPDHPHTNGKGYVYEHRLVMETRLGRFLDKGERVHHLNHDRGDNSDGNLVLFPSQSAHMRDEHADDLQAWRRTNPERADIVNHEAGRKGAKARWGKKKA